MIRFNKLKSSRLGMVVLLAVLIGITLIIWFSLQFAGKNRIITKLDIQIKPDTGIYFVSQQEITDIITKTTGNPIGQSLTSISLSKIEGTLLKIRGIASAQAFSTLDGKLRVQIRQRIPVLRIQNSFNETFFIDSNGIKIPYKENYSPDVPAANGFIHERFKDSVRIYSTVMKQLLQVALFIKNNSFWNNQFEQCYVDNFGDIILVPRVGKHSIVIGTPENMAKKMENLRIFYIKALNNLGWDKYSVINLKYHDQIVATRNGKETEHIKPENVQNPQH
ncbi:MAG: hypothetical protein IT244_02595 [Bacteroidia bacterium]|nr:hypothetical protein [Bacteroidia bacterium]